MFRGEVNINTFTYYFFHITSISLYISEVVHTTQVKMLYMITRCENSSLIHVVSSFSDSVEVMEGGEKLNKTRYETTRRMSTYLLAFIVSDFKAIEEMAGEVLVIESFPTLIWFILWFI